MTCLNKETPRSMLVPLDKSVTKWKMPLALVWQQDVLYIA
jgi:hypothetical protein